VNSERIIGFCRYLRANGFTAGLSESIASLEAVRAASPSDLDELRAVLQPAICKSKEEWEKFDDLFHQYWNTHEKPRAKKTRRPPVVGGISAAGLMSLTGLRNASSESSEESKTTTGASLQARLKQVDFSQVPVDQQHLLDALAERLLAQASRRISRRFKVGQKRGRIDLRRTMRASIGCGGYHGKLKYKTRAPKPPPVVILLDVSGSMSLYSFFLLRFAHSLRKAFKRADTFIFSTELADIRGALRLRVLPEALRALSEKATGWASGTKIGLSLSEFNRHHSRLLARNTIFLILSDGWDTGEPEELTRELRAIKEKVRAIIWLNPLLGMPDYSPETRGMKASLPYIDVFAPAHSLESLLDLERVFLRIAR